MTDRPAPPRNAGNIAAFMADLKARATGEKTAEVPCGGCTACCHFPAIEVRPSEETAETLAHLDLVPYTEGRWGLRKRDDGACVHLQNNRCSVYHHRPRSCRMYDCRVASLLGLTCHYDGGHDSPYWQFTATDDQGDLLLQTFRLLSLEHHHQIKTMGAEPETSDAIAYVFEHMIATCRSLQQVRKTLRSAPRSRPSA